MPALLDHLVVIGLKSRQEWLGGSDFMPIFEVGAAIALLLAIVSIVVATWHSPPAIARRIELLEVDLQEAIDRMTTWMKRENVRRARDQKEQVSSQESPPVADLDRAKKKAMIRARLGVRS